MSASRDRYALLKGLHLPQETHHVNDTETDINRVELTGTVSAIHHKTTTTGKAFIVVHVDVLRTWADRSGNRHERVETIPVTSWRRGSRLSVGTRVQVEGRLTSRSFASRADGLTRLAIDVTAETIEPLDDPGHHQGAAGPRESRPQPAANTSPGAPLDDSDIPF